jgi:hypothetical protein
MAMKTAAIALLALGLLVPTTVTSSGAGLMGGNFAGALHFSAGIPQGELSDQIGRNAYGLDGQVFYSPEGSPFAVGLDASWMRYGSESRREPFSTTIPDVTVEVSTSNNIVQGFFVLRGQLPKGPIRPYADVLIGFNHLYTETKISDSDNPAEEVASTTNQYDTALAYGLGIGVTIPVYVQEVGSEGDKLPFEVLIDGGARYLRGGEADYLKEGSIRREGGRVAFDTITSKTDLVRLHLGVMVRF